MSASKPAREDFILAARMGEWSWVNQNLRDELISREDVQWAINFAEIDSDQSIHRLGAKYLAVSSHPLTKEDRRHVELWRQAEPDVTTKKELVIALAKHPA